MTVENRNFVSLTDLLGVEVKCPHEFPNMCPVCKKALFLKDGQLSYVREFIKSIGNIEARKIANLRIELAPLSH